MDSRWIGAALHVLPIGVHRCATPPPLPQLWESLLWQVQRQHGSSAALWTRQTRTRLQPLLHVPRDAFYGDRSVAFLAPNAHYIPAAHSRWWQAIRYLTHLTLIAINGANFIPLAMSLFVYSISFIYYLKRLPITNKFGLSQGCLVQITFNFTVNTCTRRHSICEQRTDGWFIFMSKEV